MWESWDMSDATRTPPVRGHRELRNFKQPNVQFLWEWDVNSSSHTSRGCTNKPFVPDGSLPCGNHGTCQTQLVHLLYEATGSFEISNSHGSYMYKFHIPGGVRTSRLCQMVAFQFCQTQHTSCTRPQGASKFQTAQCTVPMGVVNYQFSYFPGCTNKPFVPDGSLPCGNHGTCQTQLVHLLYEATGSFEISNSQMYSSYGSGM